MDIDKAIRIFSDYLNKSWEVVTPLLLDRSYTTDDGSKGDWLQCSWELLVERKVMKINEYLEIYGEGADFHGESSRITDEDMLPTHSVSIIVKDGKDILNSFQIKNSKFNFDRLVGFSEKYYTDFAPFNFVLIRDESVGVERVFSISDIKFELKMIS